jgi:hypothetical protein
MSSTLLPSFSSTQTNHIKEQQSHPDIKHLQPVFHTQTILAPVSATPLSQSSTLHTQIQDPSELVPAPHAEDTHYPNTNPTQALKMHHHNAHTSGVHTTHTTRTAKPSFMSRFRTTPRAGHNNGYNSTGVHDSAHAGGVHIGTHGGTTAPIHHHKRHVSIGDKISGAMLKLKGSLTHRSGVKAAGTRRMHGTDGRGSHRTY